MKYKKKRRWIFYYELPRFFMELKFSHAVRASLLSKEAGRQNNLSRAFIANCKVFLSFSSSGIAETDFMFARNKLSLS